MKLLFVDPTTLGIMDDYFGDLLNTHKDANTVVDVVHLCPAAGTKPNPFLPPIPDFYDDLFKAVKAGVQSGYDGILVGCAADPGLRELDYMTDVPIFAPLRSSLHIAGLLGQRTTVLCPSHDEELNAISWHEDSLRRYAIDRNSIVFRSVEVGRPEQQLMESYIEQESWVDLREAVLSRFNESVLQDGLRQAQKAVEQDRAEVLIFACTLWAGMLSPLAEKVRVPVLDPVISMLKAAEASIGSRL